MTSAGRDKGAEPIREVHFEVLVKERDMGGIDKAGTRKSGRPKIGLEDLTASSWKVLLLAMRANLRMRRRSQVALDIEDVLWGVKKASHVI